MAKKTFSSKASAYLYKRYIAGDSAGEQAYEEEVVNAEIARKIYDLRTKAGLTQQELATRVPYKICNLSIARPVAFDPYSVGQTQYQRWHRTHVSGPRGLGQI